MARETLSDELKEAGYRLLFVTDLLKMRAQGAMWIYRHELNDWRYYLVTSLVDAVGRRATYKMIARIFSAPGADGFFSKAFTLEDVHLGSPSDEFFKLISSVATSFGLRSTGKNKAELKDCTINGIALDCVVYRAVPAIPTTDNESDEIKKEFYRNVEKAEKDGIPA